MSDQALPDRARPAYPPAAADWLVGTGQRSVLLTGASPDDGLTELLDSLGHDLRATDAPPDDLPALDASVDVVLCSDWSGLDAPEALTECARVLRPGGRLALVSTGQDTKIPWVRRLSALLGAEPPVTEAPAWLVRSDRFGFVDTTTYRFWQEVNPENLDALALAQPAVAALDEGARSRKLAEVRAFYADYGRGMDGMQLPSVAHCYRASVVEHPWSVPRRETGTAAEAEPEAGTEAEERPPEPPDDSVLIDFR